MNITYLKRCFGAVAISLSLASCTTTQADFSKKPSAVSKAALCKTALETKDPAFQFQLVSELNRRGINMLECEQMVAQQKQAAAALVAVALVGTAVAVCANPELRRWILSIELLRGQLPLRLAVRRSGQSLRSAECLVPTRWILRSLT